MNATDRTQFLSFLDTYGDPCSSSLTDKLCVFEQQMFEASYQNTQGAPNDDYPNDTTKHRKRVFSQYGQLVHVKIPVGKRCGFIQFAESLGTKMGVGFGAEMGAVMGAFECFNEP
ncbi:polyadenylate-binding protein RBP45 [Artemisia annua]|uniref:Polyadenylate-binding protein RBP45 n=1 Tax=Artemisia annua TaxID=35608 RepID=A0A2U1KXF2_ARTAN|nr:polyadenylate-binding protein RBP45 [Artemisia annua]